MPVKYAFRKEAAQALLKALGLEGRSVRRIELTFDVNEAVQMRVYEYVQSDDVGPPFAELTHFFEAVQWREVSIMEPLDDGGS